MPTQRGADIVIANGASASGGIDLWDQQLVGLDFPTTWTAADLKVQVARSATETESITPSGDGGADYRDLYYNGQLVTIPVVAGARVVFDADTVAKFQGVRHLKLVSWDVGAAAAVNQGAARTIVPLVGATLNDF